MERLGRVLARLRLVSWVLFVAGGVALPAAAIFLSDSGDSDLIFAELAARLGVSEAALIVPLLVVLAVAILLVWVTTTWRHVIALAEARHAVRWAAGRPGQVGRGLPVAEPFNGFRSWLIGPAVIASILAALTLAFTLWLPSQGQADLLVPLLIGVGLALFAALCFLGQGPGARRCCSPPGGGSSAGGAG